MRQLLFGGLAALLLTGAAQAQVVLNIKDGNGSPQTLLGHNGGGANLWLNQSVCDPTTSNLCAFINSNNAMKVFLDPSAGTGSLATSANQTAVIGSAAPGVAATNSQLGACIYNNSAPALSSGQQVATQCDHNGNLQVDINSVTGIIDGSTTAGQTGSLVMGTVISGPQGQTTGTSHIVGMNSNGDLRADQMVVAGTTSQVQTIVQAHICQSHITVNPTTATDTQLVAPISGKAVYVCDYNFSSNGATNINLDSVTGASCAGAAAMDTLWYLSANSAKTDANPYYRGLSTVPSSGICLKTSAAVAVSFTLYFDQY